ncbi:hypothetical protein ACN4EK_32355 [Pantanalinema rosaneae CENA516]|uniref:hypothetical protein n=1 Tax=Pantanalinema rosaneae TaxID=1620701 RepID=UPI003D6E2EC6
MKPSLYCPVCSRPIVDFHYSAPMVTCFSCEQRYGVVSGKLSNRSSIYEVLLYLTAKLPRLYKRYYTFQITTPERTLKRLQFSVSGKADRVPVHSGDIVSVLYTLQGYVMKKLVAITNHTTGKSYVLDSPIPSPSYLTVTIGSLTLGTIVLAVLSGANMLLITGLSALGIVLYLKTANIAHLTTPILSSEMREGRRLLADQRLMAQKRRIETRIDELHHECKSNQVLIEQVERLQQKMAQVDQTLYSARIYRATSAVKILKQQITNSHRLIREYERTAKMVEIEVDTSWIADQLPDAENFTLRIFERLEELKTIEDQNQQLKLQLAAYEEVNYQGIPEYREV